MSGADNNDAPEDENMTLIDAINTQTVNATTRAFAATGGILSADDLGGPGVRFLRARLGMDVETDEDGDLVCTAHRFVSYTIGPVEDHDYGQMDLVGDEVSIRWSNGHIERRPSAARRADLVEHESIAQAQAAVERAQ